MHESSILTARSPVDRFFSPRLPWVLAIGGTLIVGGVFLQTGGNTFIANLLLAGLVMALVTMYDLEWGFLLLVGLVLFADRFDVPGFRPFTYTIFYLLTLNVIFQGLGVGVLTSNEIHILFFVFVWIVGAIGGRSLPWRKTLFAGLATLLMVMLIGWVLYGRARGGDAQIGIWEIRALVLMPPFFVMTSQIIRTPKSVERLMWVVILSISFKAFQGIERFVSTGFTFGHFRTMTAHEDPLFFNTLFILLLALTALGVRHRQRAALGLLLLPLLLGFYVANRRATYAALGFGVVAFVALLSPEHRRRAFKWLSVFTVVFVVYLAAYWNSYGRVAMVAQAFKATLFYSNREVSDRGDNYMSALVREQEVYNLAVTVRKSPIVGIGFGNEHEWAIRTYGAFALKGYVTHNAVLWLLTKTGVVGYFIFFLFLNAIVLMGSMAAAHMRDPYLKAVAIMVVCAVVNQTIGAYAEMQLINSRNTVYLAVLMGLVVSLWHLRDATPEMTWDPHPWRSRSV